MATLAERISALSPEQRSLLEKQLQAKRRKSMAALQTIRPRRQGHSCPLSLEQEHLWFLDQLEPHSFAYNLSSSYQLIGSLNLAALEHCFNEVIRRHESLRTSFPATDGRPRQVIAPSLTLTIPKIDLTYIADTERAADLQQLIRKYTQTPFDLATGPMIRATLFKLSDTEHRLLMSLHHIVTDRWSFALLWRELMLLYEAFSKGLPSPLPELPIQFPDFALWQREWLEGDVLEKRLSYWKKQLAGASFVLELPTDRPRPVNQTFIGKRQYRIQNKELWSRLKALSNQEHTTLFMTLLAAYYVLLYRYTGQRDIVVGTPFANRNRVETEGVIGYLLNMLVLRMDMSGDPDFLELLRRVREMSTDAYANNELPFAKLIEDLQPERDLSRNPLFQVTFVFVDFPEPEAKLPDLALSQVDLDMGSSIVDLMLGIRDQQEPILIFEYNLDLFDDATITRMMIHYETLLGSIVGDPLQRLSALSIIPDEERSKLLHEWNETAAAYPRDRCAHELFESQVELRPDAVAVTCEDRKFSYAELNDRANQLARELRARGVGPERLVGVLMERSIEMVVAVLGILKAGGAYLPLDLSYPSERLSFIIDDAGVSLVLTQQALAGKVSTSVLSLDSDWPNIAAHSRANLRNVSSADNVAYTIYTSGSTGQPKGVQVCQRALTNVLISIQREPGLSATDVVLAITNLSFDIATLELLLPLISGAQLVIGSRALALDGEQLALKLDEAEITVMQATPATWRLLIESGWKGRAGLKVLSGGEALQRELADALKMRSAVVWNLYGPTETAIYSAGACVEQGVVTIGRGIANTQLYVLDGERNVLPIGCTGELHIAGEGLARGYLHRPDLTAEKFIPNPFSGEAGARMYRTGDLVRSMADGKIEYLGRKDYQVKLRGFRIELGEIEAVLREQTGIRACVVVAREDVPGDKRLVAYVVADGGNVDEWHGQLKEKLPEYMVPSSFVLLEELPLTPNGKLDRRALPAPEQRVAGKDLVAPRTPVQEILAGIWREILRVEAVGIDDSFFDLGGHSLLGTQVISRVRAAFQIELPLRRLFEGPTISELAACVETAIRSDELRPSLPVTRVSREADLPLSYAQQRLWLLDKLEPENPSYNMATAVRLSGKFSVAALEQALSQLVARHETLRTRFAIVGGAPVQVVTEPAPLPVELEDLSGLDQGTRQAELARAMKAEAQRPFVLAAGSLLRVKVVRLGDEEHVLLITMHHIISDAWSLEIFVQELAQLYEACAQGEAALLPELPVQYADYAAAQRQWLSGEALEAQRSYWKQQLGGVLPVLELPLDHVRPAVQTFRGERRTLSLTKETTDGLKTLSRREGATVFMTLLAAFKTLLHYYSGEKDIIVGTPIAGRNHAELEALIGCFLNTLVLRTSLSGDPTFRELLGRVKEVSLGAYAHQELPFELLLEDLQPVRDLSRTPLFQVLFNLLNVAETQLSLPGLVLETVATPDAGAKFDLTVYAYEKEEQLRFTFVYNADLFEASTVTQMVECYQVLLAAIARQPEQPLTSLLREVREATCVMTPQAVVRGDERFVEFPRTEIEQSITARFRSQVRQHGERTAVKTKQFEWSYRELDRRANRIAHKLLAELGEDEARVALLFEHDAPMVAAMLGVLKAGKTYVPLDPAYPRARTEYMLRDSQAAAIVTDKQNGELAKELGGSALLLVNSEELERDVPEVTLAVTAEAIAYLLYTSGSTGQAKGVMQNHRNVLHHLRTYTNALRLSSNDKLLQLASYSFDASVMDIYGALLNGATLYPVNLRSEGLQGLAAWINEEQLTVYHSTPTVYRYFMSSLKAAEQLESVRVVVLGGEESRRQDFDDFRAHFGKESVLVNGLGPTESTLALQCFMDHETELARPSVPLGYAVANTEVRLVDEAGAEVLGYGAGEIEIRSEHLARGYWLRPELTQAAFREDGRCYRTGDMARRLSDGSFEYLGRKDYQVKLRGFRIELGEIEAALREQAGVRACVVVAREDVPGDKRLVAYVVADGEEVDEWRGQLKRKLPEYMVPASFVLLEELPLTPNGKLDRRALPAPEQRVAGKELVAPRTPVQEILADIWREILQVEAVGIDDSFFDLGGHSLLGTQVISRVRDAFQIELPLRRLFEGPTISELAACVETAIRSGELRPSLPVTRVSRETDLPLSYAQQRLWLLDKLEPENPSYNMATAVRLSGKFSVAALEQALSQLVARHETLRTRFAMVGGAPVQLIAEAAPLPVELEDLSELEHATRKEELKRAMKAEAQRPFVLAAGSLLRVKVVRLGDEEHVLLITMHHIISDAWSLEIFVRELARLYEACAQGETALLPELPVQYADYAAAQRQWLSGEALAAQRSYWKQQLGGVLPVLELPLDHVRPAVQTFRGERRTLSLTKETTDALKTLSRREGATVFMTLLAAFKTLLHYYSGEKEIIVGTPIAGRNHAELEALIGCFLNTLVLRTRITGDPTFRELLGRVKEVSLGAYAHQELPFELLLEELQPVRDLSRTPLFQVLFNLLNVAETQLSLAGLVLETVATPDAGAKFDLTVYAYEKEEQLRFTFVYNADLFEASTVTQMVECYQVLLAAIARQPEQPLTSLLREVREATCLTTPPQALVRGDERFVEFERREIEQSITARFSSQVRQHGERTAVKTKQLEWSYRELDRRANRIAHKLLGELGEQSARVALLFEHDAPMVAAMLGVLKAGKTYVPLDPAYPRARTEYMLRDSQAAAIVTDKQNGELGKELGGSALCVVNSEELERDVPEVTLAVTADAIAYLLYTSGSTGQAKGVMQSHRNVLHHLCTYTNALRLSSNDKLLQLASYSFDASVMDIYGALLNGATLYPVNLRSEGLQDLAAWINEEQLTVYHSTPTVYRYFMSSLKAAEQLESVRVVVLGGEESRRQDFDDFRAHFNPESVLVNGLGPTESTLALQCFMDHETELARPSVPLGYAVADTEVRLVDEVGEEVLGYGAGEIEIRSEHLARGYWLRPELTQAAFREGGRCYRTGDMARRLSDGSFEYLGRKDYQVKVRGMRVELSEVEAELMRYGGIKSAVVVASEAQRGEKQLACYVVGNENEPKPVAGELRSYLKKGLPDYMVPTSFVIMDELPLTPNGKVDRRALQELVAEEQKGKEYVAPSTPAENIVAEIWAGVLGIELVGSNDNFFEIGGHSLLATQVISRVQETFEVQMPLRSLFEHPTLAEFVIAIEAKVVESVEALTEEEAWALL